MTLSKSARELQLQISAPIADALEEQLVWTVDTCRQVYNHFLHRLNRNDDTSAYSEQKLLPGLKKWWHDL